MGGEGAAQLRGTPGGLSARRESARVLGSLLGAAAASIAFVLAAPAPAFGATGTISGKVTASRTGTPLVGIEVCAISTKAFESEGEGSPPELGSEQASCATTGAGGAYTIPGLGAGSFFVGFGNPPRGTLDYITQYYEDRATLEEADAVAVTAGATTTIDAELQEGAELSGVVTDAATGAPVEGALVCAIPQPAGAHVEGACGFSGAQGAYTVFGVEAGTFVIYAFGQGYTAGFYGGASEASAATRVTLGAREHKLDLDLALQPSASEPSSGAGSAPGSADTGPSPGGALSGGLAPATSGARSAGIVLANSTIDVHARHEALVRLKCSAATECRGTVALSAERRRRRDGRLLESSLRIGSARFSVRAGQTVAVKVALGRAGRSLLSASHGRLRAHLRIEQSVPGSSAAITKRVVILSAHAARRKRRTAGAASAFGACAHISSSSQSVPPLWMRLNMRSDSRSW